MSASATYPLFTQDNPTAIHAFLEAEGWLRPREIIQQVGKAGDGNMNAVFRIHTTTRTFIFKQSRPWVEKYPQIAAPDDRALVEAAFYGAVASNPMLTKAMPRLLATFPEARVLLFEDLGTLHDATAWYQHGHDAASALPMLCRWLSALHNSSYDDAPRSVLENRAMRRLNHEHLFHFPLVPTNGLDLDAITEGLQDHANRLKENTAYVRAITKLGEHYLANDGGTLLHGDYYPGSWLVGANQLYVIDPEFCFLGPAEYDVGVLTAHLLFAKQPLSIVQAVLNQYDAPRGFDPVLMLQFAGMEWMRRLIGVAQLPLCMTLDEKATLLALSEQCVLAPTQALQALV